MSSPPPTLREFGVTFCVGCSVLVVTLSLFALAIRCRSTHIAPRCAARPPEVIYNSDPEKDPSQERGNPFLLGWVFWVQGLSYDQLLRGVPGTGTREKGLSGRMLNVNLDHIVLVRFHGMGLKISLVAMMIFGGISLPIYYTARCVEIEFGEEEDDQVEQYLVNCTSDKNYTKTFSSYSRFTLANIPDLEEDFLQGDHHLATFRLFCIIVASWAVMLYTCYELFHAWIDLLAMRRVYYLEYDHWRSRREELKKTMLASLRDCENAEGQNVTDNAERHLYEREIWIPHPEQRETPPNIELYSVLVGGIPARPKDMNISQQDLEAAMNENEKLDWQLSVTSAYFDLCVPNQPGYSSSVAAVTILPSASELSLAWRRWGNVTKKMSRLRFIRSRIIELGYMPTGQKITTDDSEGENGFPIHPLHQPDRTHHTNRESDIHLKRMRQRGYCAEIMGFQDEVDDEFWRSLNLGPEQIAWYSREMARTAAGCCPHGCNEERIKNNKNIDELLEMEAEAADDVKEAYLELEEAGRSAAASHVNRTHRRTLTELVVHAFDARAEYEAKEFSTETRLLYKHVSGEGVKKRSKTVKKKNLDTSVSVEARQGSLKNNGNRPQPPPNIHASLVRMASRKEPLVSEQQETSDLWATVQTIARETKWKNGSQKVKSKYSVPDGRWKTLSLKLIWNKFMNVLGWIGDHTDEIVDVMARDSTFAVVTFTSRQAAIAARHCLADARGSASFCTVEALPVAPLADASAFNICDCRGCCRPVTLTLNDNQLIWRRTASVVMLCFIYIFYTIPITYMSEYGSEAIRFMFPSYNGRSISGFLDAQFLNLFLALCPEVFMWIANFGSNASSFVAAENAALTYYWWFLVLFAIIGSSIAQMALQAYDSGSFQFLHELRKIASTIPVKVSAKWANWIILKTTIFHPLFYLLQLNTWLSASVGFKCCVRMFRGGGDGNRLPYRCYVESGVVFLCVLALAPAAPMVAPIAVLYFIVCLPLLRYVVIFTYKQPYDSGGSRWPQLFDMVITCMIVGQVLLSAMILLKRAIAPAILAGLPVFPTYMYRRKVLKQFKGAYLDAALFQSSLLDGWDTSGETQPAMAVDDREQFRKFLVDCHKAAYIPACIAATSTDRILTSEPATVVPISQSEVEQQNQGDSFSISNNGTVAMTENLAVSPANIEAGANANGHATLRAAARQVGALMRRTLVPLASKDSGNFALPTQQGNPPVTVTNLGSIHEDEDGAKEYNFSGKGERTMSSKKSLDNVGISSKITLQTKGTSTAQLPQKGTIANEGAVR